MIKKFFNSNDGYTLVELLAVIIVLVVVGGIVISILVSSLRGSNRSTSVNDIRQTGNSTMSQMAKMIAYSQTFNGVGTGAKDSNGNLIFNTNCVSSPNPPTPTPTPTAYTYIKITSFDGGQTIFSCSGNPLTISSGSASMIDTSAVSVTSCYFNCTQADLASPPIIDIHFTLQKKSSGLFSENNVSIPFETSVTPRNSGD